MSRHPDAFVIGGVLPAVARSLGVSTSSAGLLVTAFAIAYAIGGPVLAVGAARLYPRCRTRVLVPGGTAVHVPARVVPERNNGLLRLACLVKRNQLSLSETMRSTEGSGRCAPSSGPAGCSTRP